MNRIAIADRAYRKARRLERRWAPLVARALDKQVLYFIGQVKKYGIGYARSVQLPTDQLERTLTTLNRQVTIQQANETYDELRRMAAKRATIGINDTWNKEVIEYLRQNILDKAVLPVSDYSRQLILRTIEKAITEGLTFDEIIARLQNLVDINGIRARTIVRTEITRATNYGHMLGAYDSDYQYTKTWVEVKDSRTRASHRHGPGRDSRTGAIVNGVGGETVDFEKPFSNGLMFPGDPNGKAADVINCRCVVTFRLKRDANGRAIQKPKPTQYTYEDGRPIRRNLFEILFTGFIAGTITRLINEFINEEE